jgi:hypothetical protein
MLIQTVEVLEGLNIHAHVALRVSLVATLSIADDIDAEIRPRAMLDGSVETLVLRRSIVLHTNLELDGLLELVLD